MSVHNVHDFLDNLHSFWDNLHGFSDNLHGHRHPVSDCLWPPNIDFLTSLFAISHIISIFFQQTIVDEQLLLKRMSNVAIDMFGMTAVLSRATRTITKGDANADYEVSKYQYSTFITNTVIYIYIY